MPTNGATAENKHEWDSKPKALRYAERINAIEEMILDGLPEVISKLMSMAKDGNIPAARYLIDRMAGRPSRLPLPPSLECALPYNHEDWTSDLIVRKEQRDSSTAAHIRALYSAATADDFPGIGSAGPSLEAMKLELARRNLFGTKSNGTRSRNRAEHSA